MYELYRIVADDITYLSEVWSKKDIKTADIRRSSSILRGLIVDNGGTLLKVAKDFGIEVRIPCPVNTETVRSLKKDAELYICGNTEISGMTAAGMFARRGGGPPPGYAPEHPDQRQMLSIGAFRNQTSAMWMGVEISREEIIKYVSNKLGGSHYDNKRNGTLGLQYIALDRIRARMNIGHLDAIHYELLATGKFITESPDVKELIRVIEAGDQDDNS